MSEQGGDNGDKLVLRLKPYQERFLYSQKKFPALISAIGTGKTLMLLMKVWKFCEDYPKAIVMVVRKEYTDLRDSTIKDFERYFNVKPDSNKEFRFQNGSVIMFRHAAEVNVLKNINLSMFAIEQAEEFETEEQFVYLRDRLRNRATPYRQGVVIANANGHNWLWRLWIDNPNGEEYDCSTATTFDNESNLPSDFIEDLKRMEKDAPNHYKQYVMNSFDIDESTDRLFSTEDIELATKLQFPNPVVHTRCMGVDVARFGDDETVFTVLFSRGPLGWEMIEQVRTKGASLMETVGRIVDMVHKLGLDAVTIDDTGLGGGVTDRLKELEINVVPFIAGGKANNRLYANRKAEAYFKLKEYISKGRLKLPKSDELEKQLLSIRYKYKSDGKKTILGKDEMRKEGLKSPDCVESLMMALFYNDEIIGISRNDGLKIRQAKCHKVFSEV
jgi:hypothetical protein